MRQLNLRFGWQQSCGHRLAVRVALSEHLKIGQLIVVWVED